MKRLSNAVFIGSLASLLALAACGGSGATETEGGESGEGVETELALPEPSPEAVAAANALTSRLGDSEIKLVPTQRGQAEIGYTQPQTRREGDFIVTSFRVRNQAENALAGFQVDEFWFDTDGNTVTGDRLRFREPILSGQVLDIELRVPTHPAMDRSNYEFTHQNGDIEATLFDELPDPELEEGETAEEAEPEPAG